METILDGVKMANFEKIESLENWVAWKYLSGELGWAPQRIAYELWVNAQRLLEWVSARGAEMSRMADKQPEKVKELRQKWEKQYPISQSADREMLNLDIKKVVKLHRDGYTLTDISNKLKVNHGDFIYWWNRKLALINQELRKQTIANSVIT